MRSKPLAHWPNRQKANYEFMALIIAFVNRGATVAMSLGGCRYVKMHQHPPSNQRFQYHPLPSVLAIGFAEPA